MWCLQIFLIGLDSPNNMTIKLSNMEFSLESTQPDKWISNDIKKWTYTFVASCGIASSSLSGSTWKFMTDSPSDGFVKYEKFFRASWYRPRRTIDYNLPNGLPCLKKCTQWLLHNSRLFPEFLEPFYSRIKIVNQKTLLNLDKMVKTLLNQ